MLLADMLDCMKALGVRAPLSFVPAPAAAHRRAVLLTLFCAVSAFAQRGGELRFCLRAEPKTFNPILVADQYSETIRYLTGGVLIRVNRITQELEPELATSWKVLEGGRKIAFQLRPALTFSDGTSFTPEDVAFTMSALMDPNTHSPTGDAFRSAPGSIQVEFPKKNAVTIGFPAPVAGMDRLFDQVAIVSSRSAKKEMAVLGPFFVSEHKAGSYVLLERNPNYWKRDQRGQPLPYLDSIRLDIQQNRDIELFRFRQGQIHMINGIDPESFDRLVGEFPSSARDAGVSLDSEFVWFNQVSTAPIPEYKKAWFRSKRFRRAISEAINRQDLCRVVYRGHAQPASGPVSPANRYWFRQGLKPHAFDPPAALRRLAEEGFRRVGDELRDSTGKRVEFSVITNSGNKARERMAAMIQQDLEKIGIRLNIVTLDFQSLLERTSRTFDYEACLLGLVNEEIDPNTVMNVWLSSSSNHQWNPNQKIPATPWEAEIDRLMRAQASSFAPNQRKGYFDKVQDIVWEEAPFLYLVNKNYLYAISPALRNIAPAAVRPQTYWNVEKLSLATQTARSR
jgi:peptide/nickel transport system substrate-binding protein